MTQSKDFSVLPASEKKKELFEEQKRTLELFLEHGSITKAQFEKSLGDLKEKMGIDG